MVKMPKYLSYNDLTSADPDSIALPYDTYNYDGTSLTTMIYVIASRSTNKDLTIQIQLLDSIQSPVLSKVNGYEGD